MSQLRPGQKVWYVKHPTYIYAEDVKQIAREKNLKVIDSQFKSDKVNYDLVLEPDAEPKLTVLDKYKPKKRAEPKK